MIVVAHQADQQGAVSWPAGAGPDFLDGGAGADRLDGGPGDNICVDGAGCNTRIDCGPPGDG